ncbi:NgoFVII family restriction endonuclease [Mammaliicoccus sciuri]|uniref:restriction endonuclease PLD domain-containing protein n=1 Tax=Mammaliicoccus sciuri TaxID=1296 RepID=UPI001E3D8D23|nr:restriction endonuclease PLD domain-containing protein [Mammaliicoccus sciuri]MCD8873946.1 NgoFVII family restriction endonuclease [Mammaliicoccus sciuri]
MWFTNNLYQEIIIKKCKKYNKLKIISGYASAEFLERVLNEVGNVFIDLYIGMSQEGISISSHLKYKELCEKYQKVNVFYQISGQPTHIKIYQFYGVFSSDTYIGSANFSENGFFNNNELLMLSNDDFTQLFNEQANKSMSCTNSEIEKYINFYQEPILETNENQENNNIQIDIEETKGEESINNKLTFDKKISNFNKRFGIKSTNGGIVLPIVTDKYANKKWDKTGVNSVLVNKKSNLIKSNMHSLNDDFQSEEFKVVTYDGQIYNAKLGGKFNRELYVEDWNFYYEIAKIVKLDDGEPISEKTLVEFGFSSFYFEKRDEKTYLMTLIKDF